MKRKYIASGDGRVYFIGSDKAQVEACTGAAAAPLRESEDYYVKVILRAGGDVVLLDEENHELIN